MEPCAGCWRDVTVFRYRKLDGWRCEQCAPVKRACENQNQGCTYTDTNDKCEKHEYIFCQQCTECHICHADLLRGTLSAHYDSVHQDITGSTWRATRGSGGFIRLVSSAAGTAVCWYTLDYIRFELHVSIPVSSERLREFRCEVQVTHPTTGHTQTYTLDAEYHVWWDWHLLVKKEYLSWWSDEFDVIVNINKNQ